MRSGHGRPVFIHSMWRSCGTYVFNKFRHDDSLHPYFEPCSEFLAAASPEDISAAIPDELRGNLRHTGADRQSFEAFPFTEKCGVRGFQDRFAYDRFHLSRDGDDPELRAYIKILLEHAASQGRTAVAKCCRFGLRAEWLDRVFKPVSIYVVRNPDAIFCSYWSFGGARSYFLIASLLIVARNRHLALFEDIGEELQVPLLAGRPLSEAFAAVSRLAAALSAQDFRDLVFVLWAVTLVHNLGVAELVVDIDLLVESADYRRSTEERLCALVGRRFSFADVRRTDAGWSPGRMVSQRSATCARHALARMAQRDDRGWTLSDKSRAALQALF